jgi:hypothetical protein
MRPRRTTRLLALAAAVSALTPSLRAGAAAPDCAGPRYYGTYSVGRKAGDAKVALRRRLVELRDLGANMVVATGDGTEKVDLLPAGLRAVPGCSLMKKGDWQRDGRWDEAHARRRLATLAARFAHHRRVFGVCITHEVTEWADHARRVWMYRLAKEYFPNKKVIQYYGHLYDRMNPLRAKVYGYGQGGEVETDVLFVSLPAVRKGRFDLGRVDRLEEALRAAALTPGIPVWGQTSINADHDYVTGIDSMGAIWGAQGENMTAWADTLFRAAHAGPDGHPLQLSGFFWRSLGRFPFDLGHPAFAAQRARMRQIGARRCERS